MTHADPLYNDWIHQQLRVQPDGLALYDLTADRPFTWREFNGRIDALAHRLTKENIGAGDRVAYLGLNSSDVVEMFYATIRIGAVYVPSTSGSRLRNYPSSLAIARPRQSCLITPLRP